MTPAGQDTRAPGGGFGFVGRRRELALLLAALRRPPSVVLVEGEAGIGKSRLVAEATAALAAEGRQVLTGFCHPLREPFPFGPVVDALRAAGPRLPAPALIPPSAGALAPLLPDLADRLPPAPGDTGAGRYRLVQAVRSFLTAIGPAVLVVEDMHWVDEATRDLLLLLARDLPPELALLLTYRAEDLPRDTPVLGAAYRRPPGVGGTRIALTPLAEPEVHELALAALGPQATPALTRVLFERSEGLPLVAEEDLITLCEQGRPGGLADAADLTADLEHAEVPRGLRDAVTERLAALPPAAAAVADAAAVLGVPAGEDLLARVAGLDPEQTALGLTEALQAAALHESSPARYGFRHALAQQVAHRRIPGPRRTLLHRRAIAALDAQSPPPLVQIAHHTRALGDHRAWLRVAEAAADQAVALGDTGTAEAMLRRILAEPELGEEQRGRIALALSRIAANGVDSTASAGALTRIIADPRLSAADRGEIRLTLGILMATQGGDRAGYREIEQAVEELADRPDRAARAMVALAMNERDGAGDHAWSWLDRADRTLAAAPDEATAAAVRATRLTFLARAGDPAVWPRLGELPRTAGNPEVVRQSARALYNVGDIAVELGHDGRAADLLRESRRLARAAGIPYLECYSRIALLRLEGLAGRWERLDERFAALGTEFPDLAMAGAEQALLAGRTGAARGRRARARACFAAAAAYADRESQVTMVLRAAAGLAALRLAEGATEEAVAAVTPAVAALRRAGAWARGAELLPPAVEALLACGDRAAAGRLAEDAAQGLTGRDAPAATVGLHLARGLLLREARPEEAARQFERARAGWAEIGRPYDAALAAEHLARALADADPESAAARLARTADAFTALGATSDAARCQHTLRELGLTRTASPGRRGYGEGLSPRERQVAELVAQGATNQDVAQALFLSARTVEHHVASILRKLGVSRKALASALGSGPGGDTG
ncbi:AAA family ATPase [Kitasatospora sp. NBC_00374]|uniref:ATP-binding protein n=1 Tax=Kitasatospora sp. NBC_00374 TaxID=2975964 RepID=UPI00324FE691